MTGSQTKETGRYHGQHVSILSCGSIVCQIEQQGAVAPSNSAKSALDLQQQLTIQMLHPVAVYHHLSTIRASPFCLGFGVGLSVSRGRPAPAFAKVDVALATMWVLRLEPSSARRTALALVTLTVMPAEPLVLGAPAASVLSEMMRWHLPFPAFPAPDRGQCSCRLISTACAHNNGPAPNY